MLSISSFFVASYLVPTSRYDMIYMKKLSQRREIMNILFVCTGNTCRSPMAEAILKSKSNFEVQSAGIAAMTGQPTNPKAIDTLKANQIDFSGQSQQLDSELVDWADLILTMTNHHKQVITSHFSSGIDKVFTLKEYTSDDADETWQALKATYLKLEEKRASTSENSTKEEIEACLSEEMAEIRRLEEKLRDLDIVDPFGQNHEAYQQAYQEINSAIDKLIEKLPE